VRKLRGDGSALRGLSMGKSRLRKMAVSFYNRLSLTKGKKRAVL
jgi:hypothetical protein